MSKRKGKTNIKLELLNELNIINKRLKRFKNNEEKLASLISKKNILRGKLKAF